MGGNRPNDLHGHPVVSQHSHNVTNYTGTGQLIHALGRARSKWYRVCRCPPQVDNNGRLSQPAPCCYFGINIVNALDSYSSRQVLMQMAMNSIQEFNGTNQEATIPWLDHVKGVTKKTGLDPLEMGMPLCDINVASKEGTLWYLQFYQLLIEHYANILYVSDALNAYAHLIQGENESITQYLTRAKVLKCIHHNFKMCDIPGVG